MNLPFATLKFYIFSEEPIYYTELFIINQENHKIRLEMEILYPNANLAVAKRKCCIQEWPEYSELMINDQYYQKIPFTSIVTSLYYHRVNGTMILSNKYEGSGIKFDKFLRWLNISSFTKKAEIDMVIDYIITPHEFNLFSNYFDLIRIPATYSDKELVFKKFLCTLRNNGNLRDPMYYFDYTTDLFGFLMHGQNIRFEKREKFYKRFILVVLQHLHSDGAFGPHSLLSFFAFKNFKIPIRTLPIDITYCPCENSRIWFECNCSFLENSSYALGPYSLLWGYQTICHNRLIDLMSAYKAPDRLSEEKMKNYLYFHHVYKLLLLRLSESQGASSVVYSKFAEFVSQFLIINVSQDELFYYFNLKPIPLAFLSELFQYKPYLYCIQKQDRYSQSSQNPQILPGKLQIPDSMFVNLSYEDMDAVLTEKSDGPDSIRTPKLKQMVSKESTIFDILMLKEEYNQFFEMKYQNNK